MGLIAVVLIALVLQDAFEVMLLPRRVQRRLRFMVVYFRVAWPVWKALAGRLPPGQRDGLLSHFGPLSMLGLFTGWATALIFGFGLLEFALRPSPATSANGSPLSEQIYMSGATFFTLGFGDVVPHSGPARFVSVLEAGSGLGFIAVVISYLPVLYQLFARREAHVLQLDARAGSPPTATAMLCRHAEAGGLGKLDDLLREWEAWGADMLESHLSYPMLVYYRSQHDNQSWLAAVAAVMDCCALILVGLRELPPLQARMTFSMCRQIVVEMARSFRIAPSRYDGGDRLPAAAYERMLAALGQAGLDWEGSVDAEATLQALRATYEPLLDGLARHLLLALPGWVPDADTADHWQHGHRGLLARRLVAQLVDRAETPTAVAPPGQANLWRTLRRRLSAE
jgi:hypothetical protein